MIQNMASDKEGVSYLARDSVIVQKLIAPDPLINSESGLFFHTRRLAGYDGETGNFYALQGAEITFDSYFNALPAHLLDLQATNRMQVHVKATGRCILELILVRHGKSGDKLVHVILDARGDTKVIELPDMPLEGLVYARFVAIGDLTIEAVDYVVTGPVRNDVKLTSVITTFRRDDAVQKTSARLQRYFDRNPDILPDFDLLVIDNGGETDSIGFPKGRVIKNKNYGGAGGFTRGLMEAADLGRSTHVLFMDDDAIFFPESIRRTLAVLYYSANPKLAVSGSMITEAHKWRLWEASATFDRRCKPIHNGRDLRKFEDVIAVSQVETFKSRYGGWWYFCFPVEAVKTWPFPFFVRGDDIYFSLSNDFDILTIPGVVSHQDDFFAKQSPLTMYLDMRYHLVLHLTFDHLKLDRKGITKMMRSYFDRFNDAYHYESAEALIMAVEDVLKGEAFWEGNLDLAERRAQLAALTVNEKLTTPLIFDREETTPHSPKRQKGRWRALQRKLSFNGHALSDRFFYSKAVLFPLEVRAHTKDSFRRRSTITFDQSSQTGYICRIDRDRYFANRKRFKAVMKRLMDNYDDLQAAYRENREKLATKDAWRERFSRS